MLLRTTRQRRTRTVMEPSMRTTTENLSFMLRQSASSSTFEVSDGPLMSSTGTARTKPTPVPHPQEPNIYEFPVGISPEYRPLPILIKLLIGTFSLLVSSGTTWKQLDRAVLPASPIELLVRCARWMISVGWKRVVGKIFRTMLLYVIASGSLQEILPRFRPSRISTTDLATKFFLPSPLSHYDRVNVSGINDTSADCQYVHWIEYPLATAGDEVSSNSSVERVPVQPLLDAVYLNHGFGASCLSWLPVVPSLAERLRVPVVLGHDAPGFGFTDRPFDGDSFKKYSLQSSALLGWLLLKQRLEMSDVKKDSIEERSRSVLLMGHSMGCLTTLRMALLLDPGIHQHIILVAPALGLSKGSTTIDKKTNKTSTLWRKVSKPFRVLLTGIGSYALRRFVGRPGFWRKGLEAVWGHPRRLQESDILRFQWPSIGRGWERGLLQFTKSRFNENDFTDQQLLQKVLSLPNVRSLDVIVSSRDRIAPANTTRKFLKAFPNINILELEELGHDPFEEDVGAFLNAVEDILRKQE